MLKRYVAFLLVALAATQLHPAATPWGLPAPSRAMAATRWAPGATSASSGATNAPSTAFSASADASFSTGDDYTTHSLIAQEENLLNLLNQDRISAGLPPLIHDPELSRIARVKSEDMLRGNYFAHESPTWGKARQMLTAFGYEFTGCGENIARHATIQKAQAAFMTSDGHRRNILSSTWEKVGVGVVFDANGYAYVTQLFVR